MSFSTDAIAQRTVSAYSVSIGTSLALESLADGPNPPYDPARLVPERIDITQYDEFWVNMFSLYRNLVGSLQKDGMNKIMPIDVADALDYEVNIIRQLVNHLSGGNVKVICYASNYDGLNKEYPHAKIRVDKTEKQIIYSDLMVKSISAFFKDKSKEEGFTHFKLHLTPKSRKRVLILTNYALDLLSSKHFEKLDLLESHTGILKNKSMWYTKYMDGKNLLRIPWNSAFLQVFGDSTSFHPWPKDIRDDIILISEKYRWNHLTTNERVRLGIRTMKDGFAANIISSMLKD